MDPPAPLPVDPAVRAAVERAAQADMAAGRVIGCEAVVRWLGGWAMAQAAAERDDVSSNGAGDDPLVPLVWTETAVRTCHRLRLQLARFGDDGDRRLAATLVATMVAVIVEGAGAAPRIVDRAAGPALGLRIAIEADRIVVLDLHWRGAVR